MLTHTGRTYTPGSPHPRRCDHCAAPADWTWTEVHVERLCNHHAGPHLRRVRDKQRRMRRAESA